MTRLAKGHLTIVAAVLLSACSTTNAVPYKASTANIMAIQNTFNGEGIKVNIGAVMTAPGVKEHPNCRMMGPVNVAPGKTPAQYIKAAFEEELFLAQAYSPTGKTSIQGEIQNLDFSSVSPALWQIRMRVFSETSAGYSVSIEYPFKTSWDAMSACQNVANAFGPAVQELIKQVVTHQEFKALTS